MSAHFYSVRQYMAARGPCFDPDGPSPRYKLCLVATDLDYLIDVLTRAASRPDGYYVKYSATPKDGMYLGRVFLETDKALGELWAQTKDDPKLLGSIQDDHFIEEFRSKEALAKAREAGE